MLNEEVSTDLTFIDDEINLFTKTIKIGKIDVT